MRLELAEAYELEAVCQRGGKRLKAPLLQLQDVHFSYPEQPAVLAGLNLCLHEGERLGLLGASGSGKTTLLRLLIEQLRPDRGKILYQGHDLTRCPLWQKRQQRRGMQIIFQDPGASLHPYQTVHEQVEEHLRLAGVRDASEREDRVRAILRAVELDPSIYGQRLPRHLSGGQRQRVAIAAATVAKPRLLLADEALSALDKIVQQQILQLLLSLQQSLGFACLFISHDLSALVGFCQRLAVLADGGILEEGPSSEILQNPREERTKRFVQLQREKCQQILGFKDQKQDSV